MLQPQNLKKYDCVEKRGIFFLGGFLQIRRGELGWGRRRRNMGGDNRQSCDILTFADGITDELMLLVVPSTFLMENWSRHYTEIPV